MKIMSQLTYIPYLPLKDKSKITFPGGVVIWHFKSFAEEFIPDAATRDFVIKLLEANVQGEMQEKIDSIAVVSIGKTDFHQFTINEEGLVQEAKLCIFLSRIARTNTTILGSGSDGWSLATSENFEPVYQNFEVGNDHIAERAGYIINVGIGGYRVNEKKFHKPNHVVISPYGMTSFDKELYKQLLLRRRKGKLLYRRIIRAVDLVFQAYYNNANVSRNARILLMAAAFETLLDLPEKQGRKVFKDTVEQFCSVKGEPKYRHYYSVYGKKKRDKDRTIKALWADSFFQLRNAIIHGSSISEELYHFRKGDRQLDIAILFFILLVKNLLNEGKVEKPFADKIEWKKRSDRTVGFSYEDNSASLSLARIISKAWQIQKRTTK